MRTFNGLLLVIGGLYAPYFYAGNGNIVAKKAEEEEKKIVIQSINKKQECVRCKNEAKETINPVWSPCQKGNWLHKQCKIGTPYSVTFFSYNFFARDKYGVLPLSKAIFRARKDEQKDKSYAIIATIMEHVGKQALNMLLLCDHCKCSTWMHAIYSDNVEAVKTIVSAVINQVEDPEEAVWKLLTNQDSGGKWLLHVLQGRMPRHNRKLTPLMVAVKRKNIELIKLLKSLAGNRFQEYLLMKGGWGETASSFADNNDEILKLLLL